MVMVMEIITDTILISEAIITGVMILFIIVAGTHLLYSVLTSGTDGTTTITAGMVITAITAITIIIVMATMITGGVPMQIMILMVIIPIDTPLPVIHRGETPVTIRKHQLIVIMYREGESLQVTIQGKEITITDR